MIQPGPLSSQAARELNQALHDLRELIACLDRCVSPPLSVQRTGTRFHIRLGGEFPFLAKITGGTNPYDWEEQIPLPDGEFGPKESGGAGEGNAWDMAGAADVAAGTRVWMWRGAITEEGAQEYYFCPCGGGGGGGGAGAKTCDLAGLRTTDCLEATGPENAVELKWDEAQGSWISTEELTYPGGSGIVEFWYTTGAFHLSVGEQELAGCGDGCFTGGALTGLTISGGGTEACTGAVLKVCVKCIPCTVTKIYPACSVFKTIGLSQTLWVRFRGVSTTEGGYGQTGCAPTKLRLDYDPTAMEWRGRGSGPDGTNTAGQVTLCMRIGCQNRDLCFQPTPDGKLSWEIICQGQRTDEECANFGSAEPYPTFGYLRGCLNVVSDGMGAEPVKLSLVGDIGQGSFQLPRDCCVPAPFNVPGLVVTGEVTENDPDDDPTVDPNHIVICPCCTDNEPLPSRLWMSFESIGADCDCLTGMAVPMDWDSSVRAWTTGVANPNGIETPCKPFAEKPNFKISGSITCFVNDSPQYFQPTSYCNSDPNIPGQGGPTAYLIFPFSNFGTTTCRPIFMQFQMPTELQNRENMCCFRADQLPAVRITITE